jgi:uncharacterized damage-inducible protein DinB
VSAEKAQVLATLDTHRRGLRRTLDGVSDADAVARPTVSALCLGGIVQHVTYAERMWIDFVATGEKVDDLDAHAASFVIEPGETVTRLLDRYAAVARRTEQVVADLPDLDVTHPLPEAPWYTDRRFSARQVLLHLIAETSQHAGHADILRESLLATTT